MEANIDQIGTFRAADPRVEVILIGQEVIEAIQQGAIAYFTRPIDPPTVGTGLPQLNGPDVM